ncbi:MAG: hypothetical protein IMW91_05230 [Firmicutes bacterium]|nr:hypothetical protein [Bacillota bacterium]
MIGVRRIRKRPPLGFLLRGPIDTEIGSVSAIQKESMREVDRLALVDEAIRTLLYYTDAYLAGNADMAPLRRALKPYARPLKLQIETAKTPGDLYTQLNHIRRSIGRQQRLRSLASS